MGSYIATEAAGTGPAAATPLARLQKPYAGQGVGSLYAGADRATVVAAGIASFEATVGAGQTGGTPTPAPTFLTQPSITGTPTSGQPISALTFNDGTVSNGSVTSRAYLLAGVSKAASYVLQAGDVGASLTFQNTATGPGGTVTATSAGVAVVGAATAPTGLIFLFAGDSKLVGTNAADRSADPRQANTSTVRNRAPLGVSTAFPYDQAIAPDGTDYLSPAQFFLNQVATETGLPCYGITHGWNGTKRFASSGGTVEWGVGNPLHESLIARCNGTGSYAGQGAIKAIIDQNGGAAVAGIVLIEGTNDRGLGGGDTITVAAMRDSVMNEFADWKGRIFANGVSGATIGDVDSFVLGLLPESISGTFAAGSSLGVEQGLRAAAAGMTKGKFLKMPEGYAQGDSLHETIPGVRFAGKGLAQLRTDTAPAVISNTATFGAYVGQKMAEVVLVDKYAFPYLTGTDADKLEIVVETDTTDANITTSRWRYVIRPVNDTTFAAAATLTYRLNVRTGAGVVSYLDRTLNVLPVYGSQTATVTASAPTTPFNVAYTGNTGRDLNGCSFSAGMNQVVFRKTSGLPQPTAITVDGITVTPHAASTSSIYIFHIPIASARTTKLKLSTDYSGQGPTMTAWISGVNGTTATPTEVALTGVDNVGSPHSIGVTTPTNGVSIANGLSYQAPLAGAVAGSTILGTPGDPGDGNIFWNVGRLTAGAGQIGVNVSNGGYRFVIASSWAKA